jgi:hypothetical protein
MKTVKFHTTENMQDYVEMHPPTQEAWEWCTGKADADVHVFDDVLIREHTKHDGKIKVACIVESPAIYDFCCANNPQVFHPYQWIKDNHQHFNYVMSPMKYLQELVGDRYIWIPCGGSRIRPDNFGLWEKERLLSMVASQKQWTLGHKLRHQIVNAFPGKMEIYGRGYNDIIDKYDDARFGKVLAITPYYFSFAIMNSTFDDYFTEILTDVLAVGTIPLFWGTKNIGKHFNPDGIIQFETIEELGKILPTLTPELYQSKLEAVKENIERAKPYITRWDWLYNNMRTKLESL